MPSTTSSGAGSEGLTVHTSSNHGNRTASRPTTPHLLRPHTPLVLTEASPLLEPRRTANSKQETLIALVMTFLKFVGPGFMVGVGYLDPGNWATDLAAGSQYGYSLLYIVVTATIMAMLLQYLCIKLGTVTGLDLAMACRRHMPRWLNLIFYILCELAIIATDCAEVIGTAIALNLLFNIPLVWGVALTGLDVLVVLALWDQKHLRAFETAIMLLVVLVGVCFIYLLTVAKPQWGAVWVGLLPTADLFKDENMLYLAMSIVGATIMPHNLYLHSSIVKYRSNTQSETLGEIVDIESSSSSLLVAGNANDGTASQPVVAESDPQPSVRKEIIPLSLWYCNLDSILALSGALLVNSSILIVAGASFFHQGHDVAELKDAYELLTKFLGPLAGVAFAVGLLCAGQSSTITGTLAGQIVMEGFLGPTFVVAPWLQRLVTRACAIIPAMTVAILSGEAGVNSLLVFSQVILSLQLPFAIWPLVWVTSSKSKMTVKFQADGHTGAEEKSFANHWILACVASIVALLITLFNIVLIVQVVAEPPTLLKGLWH